MLPETVVGGARRRDARHTDTPAAFAGEDT